MEFRYSSLGNLFIWKSAVSENSAGGGGAARGARVPHGGAGGLPGGPVRRDARRLARRPRAAAHLRAHAPLARRHPRRRAPPAPSAAPAAPAAPAPSVSAIWCVSRGLHMLIYIF